MITRKQFRATFTYDSKKAAKHFVAVLKKLLTDADLTPPEFAEITGVPARTVNSWLAGEALPPQERIDAVTFALTTEARCARDFADAITSAFGS